MISEFKQTQRKNSKKCRKSTNKLREASVVGNLNLL